MLKSPPRPVEANNPDAIGGLECPYKLKLKGPCSAYKAESKLADGESFRFSGLTAWHFGSGRAVHEA